jgi:hypothetical protein
MTPEEHAQLAARWEAIAKAFVAQRAAMAKQIKSVQEDQAKNKRRLAALENHRETTEYQYCEARGRLFEVTLAQLQRIDVDFNTLINNVGPINVAAELASQEILTVRTEMRMINGDRLERTFTMDFEAALAGQPPKGALPKPWLELRSTVASDPAWQAAIKDFLETFPGLRQEVKDALAEARRILSDGSLKPDARLKEVKALKLSGLAGRYSALEGRFRALPQGAALLKAVYVKQLSASTAMLEAQESDGAGVAKKARQMTDRLAGLFKGKQET